MKSDRHLVPDSCSGASWHGPSNHSVCFLKSPVITEWLIIFLSPEKSELEGISVRHELLMDCLGYLRVGASSNCHT